MAEERMQRKLAAIMATDVVGYSSLVRADEEGTISRLKSLREDLIDPLIASHDGRIVKTMGDGLLVEFASAVDAVRSAVSVQQALTEGANEAAADQAFSLRIGINLGDILIDDGDIHGDGVNIAARLEALADPGTVCISDAVYQEVRDRLKLHVEDLGEHDLKNINRPVRCYKLSAAPGDAAAGAESDDAHFVVARVLGRPAVAVMPFDNMSRDPEQDYFADGLADDIISRLSLWRSFPVIGRNSSFAYRDTDKTVLEIGRSLGAQYVLEGSVRRAGERLRINASLLDVATGSHVWTERYDREMDDIFDVQDDITEKIACSVEPALHREEERRALVKRDPDLTAWEFLLRATKAKAKGSGYGTAEGNREAKGYLELAIERDPLAADAHALLADCYWHEAISGWTDDTQASLNRAVETAHRAIELDDANWLARSVLALALTFAQKKADLAVDEAKHAIQSNPSSAFGHHVMGCTLEFAGQPEKAIPTLEAVFRFDPRYRHPAAVTSDIALCHLLLDEPEKALDWAEKTIDRDPDFVRCRPAHRCMSRPMSSACSASIFATPCSHSAST